MPCDAVRDQRFYFAQHTCAARPEPNLLEPQLNAEYSYAKFLLERTIAPCATLEHG